MKLKIKLENVDIVLFLNALSVSGYDLRPETIGRIAKALGVDVTEILLEEGDE